MPALHLKRGERGSVPASRKQGSKEQFLFERYKAVNSQTNPRDRPKKKCFGFGKWALFVQPHVKSVLSSDLLRLSKRQLLQELLLALKTRLARPSPQPLNVSPGQPCRLQHKPRGDHTFPGKALDRVVCTQWKAPCSAEVISTLHNFREGLNSISAIGG